MTYKNNIIPWLVITKQALKIRLYSTKAIKNAVNYTFVMELQLFKIQSN